MSCSSLWRREQQHPRGDPLPGDLGDDVDAAQPRHPHVQDGDVGDQVADARHRLAAVGGDPHQLEPGPLGDGPRHPLPVDGVIVGDEDPDHGRRD